MGFRCGIVGLPNVGKSTLFNALSKAGIPAANYPFCTIQPNVGIVPVPDERLTALAALVKPQKIIPAHVEFIDIAGLVAGAAKGEGLGNQFLAHIREVGAIAHVVRCFEHPDIVHVSGKVDPIADIQVINTELALADLETAEKALLRLRRVDKTNDKLAQKAKALLERVMPFLNQGQALRLLSLTLEEQTVLHPYQFLTSKPVLYIANVGEQQSSSNRWFLELENFARREHTPVTVLCAKLEEDCSDLTPKEREELLGESGLRETALSGLIRAGYELLGLRTFFTAGVQEVRAWTISRGATAPQAAACIHSDFERGFIRAEVISYADFIHYKGVQGAREAGKLRLEGKTYQVQDGDVIHFLFNV